MPLRSVKMKRFIFGFQRRVWCPKWTPLSSSCFMLTTAIAASLICARPGGPRSSVVTRAPGGAPPWRPAAPRTRRLPAGTEVATAPPWAGGGRAKSTRRNGPHRRAYARIRAGFPSGSGRPQMTDLLPWRRPRARRSPHARPPPDRRLARPGVGVLPDLRGSRAAPGGALRAVEPPAGRRPGRQPPVRPAPAPLRARSPRRGPAQHARRPGPRRRGRRRGLRRDGRGAAGGERRPPRRPADDVRAGRPVGRRGPAGRAGLTDRHPRRGARRVPARGLPALGLAPWRDLPRPVPAAAAPGGPTAADGRRRAAALAWGMVDPAAPRWPSVRPGRGHYESYYLRAVHPTEPRGIWIRYTVLAPPGGEPAGQLWFTLFDRSWPVPRAVRDDAGEPTSDANAWIRFEESTFGAGAVVGSVGPARWSVRCMTDQAPLEHLPRSWMYTARLPRT